MIKSFVLLRAERLNRRALASVEHFYLHHRLIRVYAHFAAERVEFADEMPFRRSAYRRIARHKSDIVEIYGGESRFHSRPRESERGFATGMPGADHHGVEFVFNKFRIHYFLRIIFLRSLISVFTLVFSLMSSEILSLAWMTVV